MPQLHTNTRQQRSRIILFDMAIPGEPWDLHRPSWSISAGLQVPGQKAEAVSGVCSVRAVIIWPRQN